jgi:CheY-like chemotaxis protein
MISFEQLAGKLEIGSSALIKCRRKAQRRLTAAILSETWCIFPDLAIVYRLFIWTVPTSHPTASVVMALTRVLLVADPKNLAPAVSDVLQKHGYQVSEATDSRRAVSCFTKEAPEIAVLDYASLGKHCLEVVSYILSNRSSTRIIVLVPSGEYLGDMERMGVDVLLVKPFPLERLLKSTKALSKMKPPMNIVAR